jgi:hypothetical protein
VGDYGRWCRRVEPPLTGATPKASSGVADAFPRLVSRLARACNDHENDATEFVLDRGSVGATHARTPPLVEHARVVAFQSGGITRQPAPAGLTDKGLVRASG